MRELPLEPSVELRVLIGLFGKQQHLVSLSRADLARLGSRPQDIGSQFGAQGKRLNQAHQPPPQRLCVLKRLLRLGRKSFVTPGTHEADLPTD